MGVYIENMEIPTEEYGPMTIKVYPNGHVAEYIGDIGRVWDAIPVPPHGRLIDADAILQEATKGEEPFDWIDKNELLRLFFDAPTIIPAEEVNE